jgi:MFS family permease
LCDEITGPAARRGWRLAVWSYQVFPERPATGFSATVFFLGLGSVVGPATMGVVAAHAGLSATFLVTAALAMLTLLARPRPLATRPGTRPAPAVTEARVGAHRGGCSYTAEPWLLDP